MAVIITKEIKDLPLDTVLKSPDFGSFKIQIYEGCYEIKSLTYWGSVAPNKTIRVFD